MLAFTALGTRQQIYDSATQITELTQQSSDFLTSISVQQQQGYCIEWLWTFKAFSVILLQQQSNTLSETANPSRSSLGIRDGGCSAILLSTVYMKLVLCTSRLPMSSHRFRHSFSGILEQPAFRAVYRLFPIGYTKYNCGQSLVIGLRKGKSVLAQWTTFVPFNMNSPKQSAPLMPATKTILIFGDLTYSFQRDLRQLIHVRGDANLSDFFARVSFAFRRECLAGTTRTRMAAKIYKTG